MTLFLDLTICYGSDNIYELLFILIESVIFDEYKTLESTKGQFADRSWPLCHCRICIVKAVELKGKYMRRSVAKEAPCIMAKTELLYPKNMGA